jgi:N-acetylglucosamine-6-phosphate deacetylase
MTMQAIFADRAFTPHEEIADAVVIVDGGRIASVGRRGEIAVPAGAQRQEARGLTVVPGFVDVHIHGAGGRDVMEATPDALSTVAGCVAKHGTTSLVATTVTAGEAETCRAASGIAAWIEAQRSRPPAPAPQAEILGIHFEGPFISAARRGVHPAEHIATPSVDLFTKFLDAARGAGLILTLAPELPGALALIFAARQRGVVVSLGHTDASYAQATDAIAHGAQHAAHVFNAMRPFAHRETGVIGAVLTSSGITAELIADGVHVDAAAMRVLLAAKGFHGVILVSDGIAATGMPDGKYRLGTFEVSVSGGVPRNADGKLAGSTLTLDRALRNIVALGVPLAEALSMLTANPARLLGLEKKKGALVPGADADLVLLDSRLEIAGVMTRGLGWPAGGPADRKDTN